MQIDLFGLYILFSHFRPRDATRGNSFFQMSSYARANLRITTEKTKGKFPWGHHVVWNGKTKCTSRKGLLIINYKKKFTGVMMFALILALKCWGTQKKKQLKRKRDVLVNYGRKLRVIHGFMRTAQHLKSTFLMFQFIKLENLPWFYF